MFMGKTNKPLLPNVVISAVGDISFEGSMAERPDIGIFSNVRRYIQPCDFFTANLENPLTTRGKRAAGKCTLRGDPGWAAVLKEAGINLVSLANNHMMDYGPEGLIETMYALDAAGIKHVGAGMNQQEACAPLCIMVKGRNIIFLARSAVMVASPSYAGPSTPGVAYLDVDELKHSIARSRKSADLVMVFLHWGVEEYEYPTPAQTDLARQIIFAGADVIIGHHPHVLQGMHRIQNKLVAYSLGNFLFDDFLWNGGQGAGKDMMFTLSESNRKGIILQMTWSGDGIEYISKVFTRISSSGISLDNDTERENEFKRLSMPLDRILYKIWWRFYAVRREWDLRIKEKIQPSRLIHDIMKIRKKHIIELIRTLKKSSNIAMGKSTNPYD